MMVSRPLGRYPWELTSVLKLLALLAPLLGCFRYLLYWRHLVENISFGPGAGAII